MGAVQSLWLLGCNLFCVASHCRVVHCQRTSDKVLDFSSNTAGLALKLSSFVRPYWPHFPHVALALAVCCGPVFKIATSQCMAPDALDDLVCRCFLHQHLFVCHGRRCFAQRLYQCNASKRREAITGIAFACIGVVFNGLFGNVAATCRQTYARVWLWVLRHELGVALDGRQPDAHASLAWA